MRLPGSTSLRLPVIPLERREQATENLHALCALEVVVLLLRLAPMRCCIDSSTPPNCPFFRVAEVSFAEWNRVLDDEEGRTDSRDAEFKYGFPLLDLAFSLLIANNQVSREKGKRSLLFTIQLFPFSTRRLCFANSIPNPGTEEERGRVSCRQIGMCILHLAHNTPHSTWKTRLGKPTTAISISFDDAAESTGTDHLPL